MGGCHGWLVVAVDKGGCYGWLLWAVAICAVAMGGCYGLVAHLAGGGDLLHPGDRLVRDDRGGVPGELAVGVGFVGAVLVVERGIEVAAGLAVTSTPVGKPVAVGA